MSLAQTAGRAARRGALAAAACLLAGCSALSAVGAATETLEVFTLRAPEARPVAGGPAPVDLIVELPTTGGALDTDRIMIRPSALQAQYLPGVRWGEAVPAMVQGLLLRGFEDSETFAYVGRRPIGPGGDYALLSEVTDFQAEVAGPRAGPEEGAGAVVTLRLTARLVREEDVEIVAGRTFAATAAVPSTEAAAVVEGFDRAAQELVGEVTAWALGALDLGSGS